MSKKIEENHMDASEPLSKRLPFTSLKTRQRLLLGTFSNEKSFFFGTPGMCLCVYVFLQLLCHEVKECFLKRFIMILPLEMLEKRRMS